MFERPVGLRQLHPFEQALLHALFTTFEGDNTVLCQQLAKERLWFLEAGLATPVQARRLRKRRRERVDQIADKALSYVEAFGIPDICLGPLADAHYLARSGLIHPSS